MLPFSMSSSRKSVEVAAAATLDRRRELESRVNVIRERYDRVQTCLNDIMNRSVNVLRMGIEPLLERSQLTAFQSQLTSTTYFLEDLEYFCCKYREEVWPEGSAQVLQVRRGGPAPGPGPGQGTDGRRDLEALWDAIESRRELTHRHNTNTPFRGSEPIHLDQSDSQARLTIRQVSLEPEHRVSETLANVEDPQQGSGNLRQSTPPNLLDTLSEPASCPSPLIPLGSRKMKKNNELLVDFSSTSTINQTPERSRTCSQLKDLDQLQDGAANRAGSSSPSTSNLSSKPILDPATFLPTTSDCLTTRTHVAPSSSAPPTNCLVDLSGTEPVSGVQQITHDLNDVTITTEDGEAFSTPQTVLQLDRTYKCLVTQVTSPASFFVITVEFAVLETLTRAMNEYYEEVGCVDIRAALPRMLYCAVLENGEWFRCMLVDKQHDTVEVFFMDYGGEVHTVGLDTVQPLAPQFCVDAPFARQCHLAGVDPPTGDAWSREAIDCLSELHCASVDIIIDDNSSESLGVRLQLPSGQFLHELLVGRGLAVYNGLVSLEPRVSSSQPAAAADSDDELAEAAWDMGAQPVHTDALMAVQGYQNRDEADICKFYKGPPATACYKGDNCKKKHIVMHPDGWTLDRQEVPTSPEPLTLPSAGACVSVEVVHVANHRHFYVHLLEDDAERRPTQLGGGVLPLSLPELGRRMNEASTRAGLERLHGLPVLGELVAALYEDSNWYRAQTIETDAESDYILVLYVDYGNRRWVSLEAVRQLRPEFLSLPFQAVPCQLADVALKKGSQIGATKALTKLIEHKRFVANVVSQVSTGTLLLELMEKGFSVSHLLALQHMDMFTYHPSPRPEPAAPAAAAQPPRIPG